MSGEWVLSLIIGSLECFEILEGVGHYFALAMMGISIGKKNLPNVKEIEIENSKLKIP